MRGENFSNWRNDLREVVDEPESKAEKEVTEKKVKNKVIINPKLTETVDNMGGTLLKVEEVSVELKPDKDSKVGGDISSKERRQNLLKKQVLLRKLQAVRQGAGQDIVASYDPIEDAVEYFYSEGINEEGLDLIIEEVGLDDFVDFVTDTEFLTEERKARKMNVRTLKATKKKAEEIKADKSDVVKKSTPLDTVRRARTERAFKKPKLAKPAPKKEAPKPVAKKVEKAVKKVKPAQPKKEVSKDGIRAKVKSAYEAGVKRHRKATQPIRVFHKGMKKAPKAVAKAAVDVKRAIAPRKEKVKEEVVLEKDLNAAERRALPDKEFALPGKGKGPEGKQAGSYPIPDKSHARMALAMVAKHGTPEKKEKVRAAVAKKFPGIQQEDYETQKRKEVLSALKRDKRPLDKKTKDKIAADIVKKKGDTSKSDDRYAYESLQQEGLVGAKVDSQKEVNRATRKAAFRPFKNTTPPKLKVAEDKAFDNVVGKLRKKYGKDAVLTKDSPKPKAQPRPKAKPDTRTPEQKKKDQDHANVMARYGGEANYKAGRGLGT